MIALAFEFNYHYTGVF